jgi:hypothetical protein
MSIRCATAGIGAATVASHASIAATKPFLVFAPINQCSDVLVISMQPPPMVTDRMDFVCTRSGGRNGLVRASVLMQIPSKGATSTSTSRSMAYHRQRSLPQILRAALPIGTHQIGRTLTSGPSSRLLNSPSSILHHEDIRSRRGLAIGGSSLPFLHVARSTGGRRPGWLRPPGSEG